jgi:uridine kinase
MIGIAGPSCAGKTELARQLAARLQAAILPLDGYYHDLSALPLAERAAFNFDDPAALDHELFVEHLRTLKEGREIRRPVYDFSIHARTGRFETVRPGGFLVAEGLFLLYWEDVRPLLQAKIYVDLGDAACLERRIVRDVRERGRTPDSVRRQYEETVRPMAESYVRPTRAYADLVMGGNDPLEVSVARIVALLPGAG